MRPAWLVAVLGVPLLACDSEKVIPTTVSWMEWPADVQTARPFRVRMIVFWPCASGGFRVGSKVGPTSVTLNPFFTRQNQDVSCIDAAPQDVNLTVGSLDTAGFAPPLRVTTTRSFVMSAPVFTSGVVPLLQSAENALQSFGLVTVHPRLEAGTVPARRNAGGYVRVEVDAFGCVRLRTGGAFGPKSTVLVDSPADTIGMSGAFVTGYIYEPAEPICGETEAFHRVPLYRLDEGRR